MSAKLRSFIDYLRSSLRLWRRGRRLPARVQIVALVATAVFLAVAAVVWRAAWARPDGGDGDADGRAVYEQVRAMRIAANELPRETLPDGTEQVSPAAAEQFAAARAIATTYVEQYPTPTVVRQLVQYEYAVTFYCEDRPEEALAAFQGVVTANAGLGLDAADPDCKVDDAQFFVGWLHGGMGQWSEAYAAYMAVYDEMPSSNRVVEAMCSANSVLLEEEKSSVQDGIPTVDHGATIEANVQRLITEHPAQPGNLGAIVGLVDYFADRPSWNSAVTRAAALAKVTEIVEWAVPLVDELRQSAEARGDTDGRRDAACAKAQLLRRAQRCSEASDAYLWVYNNLPADNVTIDALRLSNEALIYEELENWKPKPAAQRTGWRTIRHLDAIEANVQRLTAEHPEHAVPAIMDLMEYHRSRAYFNEAEKQASHERMKECAEQVRQVAPGTPEAVAAGYGIVFVLAERGELTVAGALAEQLRTEAAPLNDPQLYMDAKLNQASVLRAAGQHDAAIAMIEEVLATDVPHMWDPIRRDLLGELTMDIAMMRTSQGRISEATSLLDGVQHNEEIPADLRGLAALLKGLLQENQGQREDAAQAYGECAALSPPDSVTAETAQRFLERVSPPAGSGSE